MRPFATLLVTLVLVSSGSDVPAAPASFDELVAAGAAVPLHLARAHVDAVLARPVPEERALEYIEIASPADREFVTACLVFANGISDATRTRLGDWIGGGSLELRTAAVRILESHAVHHPRCRKVLLASWPRLRPNVWPLPGIRPPILSLDALEPVERCLAEGRGRARDGWLRLRLLLPLLERQAARPGSALLARALSPPAGSETWGLRVLTEVSRRNGANADAAFRERAGRLLGRLPAEPGLRPAARDLLAALDSARKARHPGGAVGYAFALGYAGLASEEVDGPLRAALSSEDLAVRCAAAIAVAGRGAPRPLIEKGLAALIESRSLQRFAVAARLGPEPLAAALVVGVGKRELETLDQLLAASEVIDPSVVAWLRSRWSGKRTDASWPQIRCGLLLHRLGETPEGLWDLIGTWIFREPGSYQSWEYDQKRFLERLVAAGPAAVPDEFAEMMTTWLPHARPEDLPRVALVVARFGVEHPEIRRAVEEVLLDDPEPDLPRLAALLEKPAVVPPARWPVQMLRAALASRDASIRAVAARCAGRVLASRDDGDLAADLVTRLGDENASVHWQAILALPRGHPGWRAAMADGLRSPDPEVRCRTVSVLSAAVRDAPTVWIRDRLLASLDDPDPTVALETMVVLARAARDLPDLRPTATRLLARPGPPRQRARLRFLLAH